MINKTELIYNLKSLFAVWLEGKDNIEKLSLSLTNDNGNEDFLCNINNASDKAAEILMNNSNNYYKLTLYGFEKEKKVVLGILDIIN